MIRILAALGLLMIAIAANAALYLRADEEVRVPQGETRATLGPPALGPVTVLVPRAYVREASQWAGGRLDRLDLALRADDFGPMPPTSAKHPFAAPPERLVLTLTAANPASRVSDRFQLIYSRFISAETRSHPNGLVTRSFRAGTPYEDREVHIGAGTGRLFYAICPRNGLRDIEPCVAELLVGSIAAELRFPVARIGEWRRLSTESARLIEGWRNAANPPAVIPAADQSSN